MNRLLRRFGPALAAVAPSVIAAGVFFYGCIGWMVYVSFTRSKLLPNYDWAGTVQYERLAGDERWHTALGNLLVFGLGLIVVCLALGALLAIFLDQQVRGEGLLLALELALVHVGREPANLA